MSISKPNFVEIYQMDAKIYFMAIKNGLGRGHIFKKNEECVNILGCFAVTFYEYKNVFLMLVGNVCTIQALFVTEPLHYCGRRIVVKLMTDTKHRAASLRQQSYLFSWLF